MANEEHLRILMKGVEAWNEWRESTDEKPDLSDASLIGADLRRANLGGAKLIGADLSRANLRRAKLIDANLCGANLSDAKPSDADLSGAHLIGADLSGADLRRATLTGANLSAAKLIGAKLHSAKLSRANLSGADLGRANLSGATHVNLIGARNYSLDGIDTSTWIIPPAPLLPSLERFWPVWPYSDPWSSVRRSYTGVMTAFHLLLAGVALSPYLLRAVIADAGENGSPRFAVALGQGRADAWFLVPTGILLVGYNLIRMFATWWLSQLREEEVRSGHAPAKSQYWGFWLLHKFFLRWVGYFALVTGVWRTCWWLSEKV